MCACEEVARVAMENKDALIRPTPAQCRARLPALTTNKKTKQAMSDKTVQRIFKSRCYDKNKDDPWQWLGSAAQEYLPESMKPSRAIFAKTFLEFFSAVAWLQFCAIDPCRSLLPKTRAKSEEQRHAAMGKMNWRSKKEIKTGKNLAGSRFAKSQVSGALSAHWTPVFARGKVKIYLCELDQSGVEKLTDSESVAKFVREVLPGVLAEMQREFSWSNTPKVLVHDRASYFAGPKVLQADFALSLRSAGLRSWLGDYGDDVTWVAARLGDFYPHETLISHIRRLLTHKFVHKGVGETLVQFRRRLDLVEQHFNSGEWSESPDALLRLGKSYRDRAEWVKANKGDRIPK